VAALENEDLARFSSDLHARGFLRNYASFLGLDVEEMLKLYDARRGIPGSRRSQAQPLLEHRAKRRSMLAADLLLGLVAISLLGLSLFSVYVRRNQAAPTATPGPLPTATATALPVYQGTSYEMEVYLDYAATP